MTRRYLLLTGTLLLLSPAPSGFGWETDVHQSLTHWLALQAGFSPTDAREVAAGDQSLDEGSYAPAPTVVIWAILRGDRNASESVRDNHFPSEGKLPSPPEERTVRPGSDAAYLAVNHVLGEEKARPEQLRELGKGLHPLQDSWSHQGVPDSPFRPLLRVRPTFTFGHPAKRNGWSRHDADLTYLHAEDLVATALATYEVLGKFLKTHPGHQKTEPRPWEGIRDRVRLFANARTKEEKHLWLTRAGVPDPEIVSTLSLPGNVRPADSGPKPFRAASWPGATAEPPPPPEASELLKQLQRAWTQRQTDAVVSLVSWRLLKDQFAELKMEREEVIRWCKKFVNMWWVEDHGAVNAAGHCDPTHPGYPDLPESPRDKGPFKTRSASALGTLGPGSLPRGSLPEVPVKVDREALRLPAEVRGDTYAFIFPAETSRDAVALVVGDVAGEWRIVRMVWVVT